MSGARRPLAHSEMAGDAICRVTSVIARTDGARAVGFISFAAAPEAEVADILACGCTAVNKQGQCTAE